MSVRGTLEGLLIRHNSNSPYHVTTRELTVELGQRGPMEEYAPTVDGSEHPVVARTDALSTSPALRKYDTGEVWNR